MTKPEAVATQSVDDARVRVTRFDFVPGAETGWHTHGMDYVICAVTDCHMRLEDPDGGVREVFVKAGESYRREAGVEHNVTNGGDKTKSIVEVELK